MCQAEIILGSTASIYECDLQTAHEGPHRAWDDFPEPHEVIWPIKRAKEGNADAGPD